MQTHIVPVGFDHDRMIEPIHPPFSGFKPRDLCPKTKLNPSIQMRQSASI